MEHIATYVCNRCHQRTPSLNHLFRHYCTWHGTESDWQCNLEGCTRTYRLYRSFRKHVSRHHGHLLASSTTSSVPPVEPQQSQDETGQEVACSGTSVSEQATDEAHVHDASAADPTSLCTLRLSSLFLKWQEGRQLPESTMNEIASDLIAFTTEFKEKLSLVDTSKLQELKTKTGRENQWKGMHTFVSPRRVSCSHEVDDTYEYVPILETIQAVAKTRGVFESIQPHSGNLLRDVPDGTYFQQHLIFSNANNESLLALQLYFDEFEVCNPLGSKRGKHKVLAGYLTILNSSPKFRSKLNDKYLVLLAKSSLVKKFGLHKIFQPLLADIQNLETNGVELNGEVVKGSLLYVCGDNLSSHQIGGFRECFSSGPICRFCMATKEEIDSKWHEHEFTVRTKEVHARHVELTQTDQNLSQCYGVTGQSCLSSLKSFDITQGLPPDVMHDIFEGVIPFVMKHVIRHLITNTVFTLDELNNRLSSFPFQGTDKKSRLPPLSRQVFFGSSAMKGSAAEKLCFFRYFSLIIGDRIPDDNEAYGVYRALRTVTDILLAPQVPRSVAAYLKVQIEDFYSSFKEVFPDVSIIPKMHYLIHYPRLLLLHGPLSKLSCMRFEAKHQFFKSIAKKTRNFRNICATLSRRHQLSLMHSLAQPVELITTVGGTNKDFGSLPQLLKDRLEELGTAGMHVECFPSVTLSARTVCTSGVLPLVVQADELPRFAQVELIACCDKKYFIVASILETEYFHRHLHCFVVAHTSHNVLIENIGHLEEYFDPMYLYNMRGNYYVSHRYTFFTEQD